MRDWLPGLFDRRPRVRDARRCGRGPATHVVILDGTMSSLEEGHETNAGLTYKLLREAGLHANLTVHYEAGVQWRDWASTRDVMVGRGINRQIRRAYGVLASRYRPGDRIVLVGYSRGAFAVRSLSGVIGRVGLVEARHATVRAIRQAYRHYRTGGKGRAAANFRRRDCHAETPIEAVAVWDTVKALGVRWPILWRWAGDRHDFHDHGLGPHVRRGFHALALDETRHAFTPVLWQTGPQDAGRVEQVWFRGTHGDVGGQVARRVEARALANIPLHWMLDRLEACGLPLPDGWRARFVTDPRSVSVGTWGGWGKIFLRRHRRTVGLDGSERLHGTALGHPAWPVARIGGDGPQADRAGTVTLRPPRSAARRA